jgi:hypothetical protein
MTLRTTLLAFSLVAASGCTALDSREFRSAGVQPLKNARGHVIGHKETLRSNGETLTRIALYVPRLEDGKVVGYEELVRGGAVLRNLEGRRVGGRFVDLRSQGTNPGNRGLTIIVHSRPAPERIAAPDIDLLRSLARLD